LKKPVSASRHLKNRRLVPKMLVRKTRIHLRDTGSIKDIDSFPAEKHKTQLEAIEKFESDDDSIIVEEINEITDIAGCLKLFHNK